MNFETTMSLIDDQLDVFSTVLPHF